MGMIFPLTWPGRIILILVAIAIALIWSMLQYPMWWKKHFRKEEPNKPK